MRGLGLVFDWSDIRKIKQAFTWNKTTKTLHVTIPETFSIDPSIFEDGFEGQDIPPWETYTAGSSTVDMNHTTTVYEGSESAECVKASSAREAYAFEDFGVDYETLYTRVYVRWSAFPASDRSQFLAQRDTGPVTWLVICAYASASGNFTLRYRDSDVSYLETVTDYAPSINTWYCVEVLTVIGNGDGKSVMWVDDVEIANETGLDNDGSGSYDIRLIRVGENYGPYAGSYTVFVDAVVCDNTTYIGPISVGDNYYEWPDIDLIFSLSTIRSFHLTLPFAINLRFLMSSTQLLYGLYEQFSNVNLRFIMSSSQLFYQLFRWNPSINLRLIMSSMTTLLGFNLVNPSIILRFALSSMTSSYYLFNQFPNINLRLIMSSTSQAIIGLFNVNPTINLRIILNSWTQLTAHYWLVSPVINLIFNLGSFSIIPTVYTINDAIMIGAIAFIIAICSVVIAVSKRD